MALSSLRLKADPSVGVRELQTILVSFLKKQQEKDIFELLNSTKRIDWKTAPATELLGDPTVAPLYCGLFKICSNGVISKAKLKKALWATQTEYYRLNHSKMHDDDYIDAADERIRILAHQYRELKKFGWLYDRTMRKVTNRQKETIDEVLSMLSLDSCLQEEGEKNLGAVPSQPMAGLGTSTAIVPYIAPKTEGPDASKPAQESCSGIFKRILKKRISSPKPEKVPKLEDLEKVPQVQEQQKRKEDPFVCCLPSDSSSELEEIPAMVKQAFNLESKKKKVEQGSVEVEKNMRNKPGEVSFSKDEEDLIALAMSSKVEEPSKSGKDNDKKKSKVKEKGQKGTEKKSSASKKVDKKEQVEMKSPHKSSKRRRVKDSAYHKARNAARLAGCSPGTAKLRAREAGQKAAMIFDAKAEN